MKIFKKAEKELIQKPFKMELFRKKTPSNDQGGGDESKPEDPITKAENDFYRIIKKVGKNPSFHRLLIATMTIFIICSFMFR